MKTVVIIATIVIALLVLGVIMMPLVIDARAERFRKRKDDLHNQVRAALKGIYLSEPSSAEQKRFISILEGLPLEIEDWILLEQMYRNETYGLKPKPMPPEVAEIAIRGQQKLLLKKTTRP